MNRLRKNRITYDTQQICVSTKEQKTTNEINNRWYDKTKEKKEKQEVQNTLTLKYAGKTFTKKVSSFKNLNSIANCKLISKISFVMHLSYHRDHTFMTST